MGVSRFLRDFCGYSYRNAALKKSTYIRHCLLRNVASDDQDDGTYRYLVSELSAWPRSMMHNFWPSRANAWCSSGELE
jgi:hypothetical protein